MSNEIEFKHWLEIESMALSLISKSDKHSMSALIVIWARKAWHASVRRKSLELLENDCLIGHTVFMKGTLKKDLIEHAERAYEASIIEINE
jgi:hypothetical protein